MLRVALLRILSVCVIIIGASSARADWTTYAGYLSRTGLNLAEHTIGPVRARSLHQRWATMLDGGAITAQPIIVPDVPTANGPRALAYVGTEGGRIAALDVATGAVVWQYDTGTSTPTPFCGDLPDGKFGITATAVYSRYENRLYSMGGDGKLYAFDPGSGAVVPGWPVTILPNPTIEHVYGALTWFQGGVYIGTASMCDNHTYHGRVLRVQTRNPAHVTHVRYMDGTTTSGVTVTQLGATGGGVWGAGGVSVDTAQSPAMLYVGTGNVLRSTHEYDFLGEQVVEMGADLSVVASNYAPLANPDADQDFGSTPVLFQSAPQCPLSLAVINKSHVLLIYDRAHIANGPIQRLANNSYVGNIAWDPADSLMLVTNLDRVEGWRAGANCQFTKAWSTPASSGPDGDLGQAVSPPTFAFGVLYYGNGAGNTLYAIDAKTGAVLSSTVLGGSIFGAPTVVNGQVLVSAWDGQVYAFAP